MAKPRVHEIAKELGITSREALFWLDKIGENARGPSSTLETSVAQRLREHLAVQPNTTTTPVGQVNPAGTLGYREPPSTITVDEPVSSVRLPPVRDASKVFVVHGRDLRPVGILRRYLLFLGLHVMAWSEAVALTEKSQPHTYDIVKAGIDHAAAVIVIFSPDDLARVKDDFSESSDDPDRTLQGQPRQNVTLEAGMAFATAPDRTIFLRSGSTRGISDIAGFNWVSLNGTWDSRADLKSRLEKAGAAVRLGAYNLADDLTGPFKVE